MNGLYNVDIYNTPRKIITDFVIIDNNGNFISSNWKGVLQLDERVALENE